MAAKLFERIDSGPVHKMSNIPRLAEEGNIPSHMNSPKFKLTYYQRIRKIDVRIIASVAAALLLIIGVMWTIPTTPDSNNFTFDSARPNLSNSRPIEINQPIAGQTVDGSHI